MPKRKTQLTTLKPSKPVKKVIQEEIKSLLKRLVAIELKMEHFKAEYKGQMELYLRWLDRYERQPGEDSPIGLILCAGKSDEQVVATARLLLPVARGDTRLPSFGLPFQAAFISSAYKILFAEFCSILL